MTDPIASHGRELLCHDGATTAFAEYIDLDADNVGAAAVGVWTKADSVTVFDDFRYGWASK
jgi:hypothetical protein